MKKTHERCKFHSTIKDITSEKNAFSLLFLLFSEFFHFYLLFFRYDSIYKSNERNKENQQISYSFRSVAYVIIIVNDISFSKYEYIKTTVEMHLTL